MGQVAGELDKKKLVGCFYGGLDPSEEGATGEWRLVIFECGFLGHISWKSRGNGQGRYIGYEK